MAFPISMTSDEAFGQFKADMRQVKGELVGLTGNSGWYVRLQTQDVNWAEFVRMQTFLTNAIARMDAASAVPGIVQYVKDQVGNQNYDVAADYATLRASVVAIRDWIFNNLPKVSSGGSSYIAVQILAQDGSLTDRMFTPAMTAPLRTLIDAYKPTIT